MQDVDPLNWFMVHWKVQIKSITIYNGFLDIYERLNQIQQIILPCLCFFMFSYHKLQQILLDKGNLMFDFIMFCILQLMICNEFTFWSWRLIFKFFL
jgi:hypothetical protein